MKKQFLILFTFISVLALSQVPQRFNKVIVTGDITSPKFIKTGSNADSVLLGNGSARSVNSLKTDTVSLSNRINAKATGNGTANGTNTGDETTATIKTKLGAASSSNSGYLVNTDWAKFNTSYTSRIQSVESPLYFTAGTIGSGYASSNSNGLLSSTDWGTFNGKQNALGSNQTTALSNLTGINFNTVPKSTAGGYANSLITDDGTTVSVSGNLTATNLTATNTGDETLTSIKTKLGAATPVSDGYLRYQDFADFSDRVSNATHTGDVTGSTALTLATVNSNVGIFNNVTINAKGLATAGSNVSYLTGITSGQVTTALGYTPKPTFTENTGFNKNFGTTTGTVLEGRTFGTAANSAVGDFIHNLSVNTNTFSENGISQFNAALPDGIVGYNYGLSMTLKPNDAYAGLQMWAPETDGNGNSGEIYYRTGFNGTKRNWRKIYDDRNLTSSLTTNYIPKWNGSSFVNSLISDDGYSMTLNGYITGTTGIKLNRSGYNTFQIAIDDTGLFMYDVTRGQYLITFKGDDGRVYIPSTTPSTAPTNGALVVVGGIGADHVRANNFYGNGSNLTGIQRPITLTTNGTSGAATFSGNTLNVPNYGNNSVGAQFISTTTNISNISASSVNSSYYTKVQDIWNIAIGGQITPAASGYCTLRLSTPTISAGYLDVYIVNAFNSTGQALIPAYKASSGVGYIEISFYAPGTGDIGFTLMGLHRGQ